MCKCENESLFKSHPEYNGSNIGEICEFYYLIEFFISFIISIIIGVLLFFINNLLIIIPLSYIFFITFKNCPKKCCKKYNS